MKSLYETPAVELLKYTAADVIASSVDNDNVVEDDFAPLA